MPPFRLQVSPRCHARLGIGLLVSLLVLVSAGEASQPAADDASDPAYADGWQAGDDGGSGWGDGWQLSSVNDPDEVVDFFIGSSTTNGDGDDDADGDIDAAGQAFGLFTRDIAQPNAYREFSGTLEVGQTVSFEIDTEAALSGSAFLAMNLITTTGQIALDLRLGSGSSNYMYIGGSGFSDTGVAGTDEGVRFDVTLTGPGSFSAEVTPLDGSPGATVSDTLASPNPIRSIRFSFQGSGAATDQRAYFNHVTVPEPGANAALAALTASAWMAHARRRRAARPCPGVPGPSGQLAAPGSARPERLPDRAQS